MKKFWEKYKTVIIIVLAIGAFVTLSLLSEGKEEEALSEEVEAWTTEVKEQEIAITLLALSYCGHCETFRPIITKIATDYNIPLYWFEMDILGSADTKALSETVDFSDYEGSSPYMGVTKKGEVVLQTVGALDEASVIEKFKEKGIIK